MPSTTFFLQKDSSCWIWMYLATSWQLPFLCRAFTCVLFATELFSCWIMFEGGGRGGGDEEEECVSCPSSCVSCLTQTIQTRTSRWKLIETSAGLSKASSRGPEMIKGTYGVTHTHIEEMTLILCSQSHVPLPDELYKKWWASVYIVWALFMSERLLCMIW